MADPCSISEALVFRGGTALNKLFLKPPSRYSEDIDFVQKNADPIGNLLRCFAEPSRVFSLESSHLKARKPTNFE